jgi:hypothetical protein
VRPSARLLASMSAADYRPAMAVDLKKQKVCICKRRQAASQIFVYMKPQFDGDQAGDTLSRRHGIGPR